jgi:hypothetical protein
MDQEITASYVFTAEELVHAQENLQRAQVRGVFRAGIIFLALMAILAGWCSYRAQGWSVFAVLFPLLGLYMLFFRKHEVRWLARWRFTRRPDKGLRVDWTLGEHGYRIKTGQSDATSNWNLGSKVRKARNGYLLYPNARIGLWLPFTAFASEAERCHAEELLRNKVKDFAEIK